MLPQIRVVKCKSCGHRETQRITKYGRFDNIKVCPKCDAKKSFATLRIMTQMPG